MKLIPLNKQSKKEQKKYMTQIAKVIALAAISPALSALVGLWNPLAGLIVLILAAIFFIWLGTKLMLDERNE